MHFGLAGRAFSADYFFRAYIFGAYYSFICVFFVIIIEKDNSIATSYVLVTQLGMFVFVGALYFCRRRRLMAQAELVNVQIRALSDTGGTEAERLYKKLFHVYDADSLSGVLDRDQVRMAAHFLYPKLTRSHFTEVLMSDESFTYGAVFKPDKFRSTLETIGGVESSYGEKAPQPCETSAPAAASKADPPASASSAQPAPGRIQVSTPVGNGSIPLTTGALTARPVSYTAAVGAAAESGRMTGADEAIVYAPPPSPTLPAPAKPMPLFFEKGYFGIPKGGDRAAVPFHDF
mmetsp:Transcript_11758/g.29467  ORF Transcript_11758/g.29467 Transcript_11758/m.29467 type:complete len:290 (-) Transcript_11758:648-1517(-)